MFDKLKKIVCEELNVDNDNITMNTHLVDDLGADSLDAIQLIMALEDEFDVKFDDEDAQKIQTIGDIIRLLEEKLK